MFNDFLERDDLRTIVDLSLGLGVNTYLVGGALRDLLLKREANDLDFALESAWEELPRLFAERTGGTFFWLDKVRLQARVVKKLNKTTAIHDFAPLNGETIFDDLARRDFTINALAFPLSGKQPELLDPLHGADDLHAEIIKVCGPASIDADPLRLLRAIRLSAELGFAIEGKTWETLCRQAQLLRRVARERVRDELFRFLAAPGCATSLGKLGDSGLWLEVVAPLELLPDEEGIVRAEAVERLGAELARGFADEDKRLANYLSREVEGGVTVLAIIKLAAFLGSQEKGMIALLAERLRLGNVATRVLALLCGGERELCSTLEQSSSDRPIYRFFRDREPAGPAVLVLARGRGAISGAAFSRLMKYYSHEYDADAPDLFLSGEEIMKILEVPPGRAVGEVMARLREAEAVGKVESREEARDFVKNLLTSKAPIG